MKKLIILIVALTLNGCVVYECSDIHEANDPVKVYNNIEAFYKVEVPGSVISEIQNFMYLIVTPEGETWIVRCDSMTSWKPTSEEKLKFKQL